VRLAADLDLGFAGPALRRCGLYLGPLSVAIAAADLLDQVVWLVPTGVLLVGWAAAQALTNVGTAVAGRYGPAAGARLAGAGFLGAAALWAAAVWVAPAALLGGDRWLAAGIGAGGLAALATMTAALVTRAETAVIGWSVPCWALAAVTGAGGFDGSRLGPPLLAAAIAVALLRAFWPAFARRLPQRPSPQPAQVRRSLGFLIVGAAQVLCLVLLWRSGRPGPAVLPVLIAVPLLEGLVGWHVRQVDAGLDLAESSAGLARHLRGVALVTVAALLPPLAVGGTLAVTAYSLPPGLAVLPGARAGVLALAAGTLLGGVFTATCLLTARGRVGYAAALAVAPPVAVAVLPMLPAVALDRMTLLVIVLTATHFVGLLTVASTAADHRGTP
jgi:hypothetical protein